MGNDWNYMKTMRFFYLRVHSESDWQVLKGWILSALILLSFPNAS